MVYIYIQTMTHIMIKARLISQHDMSLQARCLTFLMQIPIPLRFTYRGLEDNKPRRLVAHCDVDWWSLSREPALVASLLGHPLLPGFTPFTGLVDGIFGGNPGLTMVYRRIYHCKCVYNLLLPGHFRTGDAWATPNLVTQFAIARDVVRWAAVASQRVGPHPKVEITKH